jgi:hypothetical protein
VKILPLHARIGISSEDGAFDHLMLTMRPTFRSWNYLVNWEKAFGEVSALEVDLNLLNSLLGKPRIRDAFISLIVAYPQVVRTLPYLLATEVKRGETFNMVMNPDSFPAVLKSFDLTKEPEGIADAESIFEFVEKTGLVRIFQDPSVRNLVDYVLGVEVGLDSNARKNRSGSAMESLVERKIIELQGQLDFEYISQATPSRVESLWGLTSIRGLAVKKFDFAIRDRTGVTLVEANYYSAGGSKLSSVCGTFVGMKPDLDARNLRFIWVTDGLGWNTEKANLRKAFSAVDHLFNLDLLEEGGIEEAMRA